MEKARKLLTKKFNKNTAVIKNLRDHVFDTKSYLLLKDTLIFKECYNLEIIIDSTINRLEFIKCKNIQIKVNKLIAGLNVEKCDNIKLTSQKINSVTISKSYNITLEIDEDVYLKDSFDSKKVHYL